LKKTAQTPVVLSIAGSDNSAGAGIQADLKSIQSLGGYGLTAVTCVVAEIPGRVEAIQAVRADLLAAQIRLCFEAFPIAAVKTGMLFSSSLIGVVVQELERAKDHHDFSLVVDPVMIASSGDPLLRPGAVALYQKSLFPLATLITPNLDELSLLEERSICSLQQMEAGARSLMEKSGVPVLAKGGHLRGSKAIDLLVEKSGVRHFEAEFVRNGETHGTGCSYSAAIATGLAKGLTLQEAVTTSKQFITRAIASAYQWGPTKALRHEGNGKPFYS